MQPEPRTPTSVVGEELVVRGGRIGLILAATVRDIAREIIELALVVDTARRDKSAPAHLEAEATDESG